MIKLRRALAAISYVAIGGAPILAATGVGTPISVALGAVGLLAGGVLHFLDSPRTPQDAAKLGEQAANAVNAVKAARGKK